ncbi:hypothetical protein KO498_06330 [Lentibacter algarum]|uniref:hypothetical protein n=1 Tax=Lentibacter algarum TaxID=576131 RepID=UPI001C06B18D|nr:hypothetical protein [Lentibacter algarum]MBU2981428.1 hypothetical protein [Lentibacter algarum]
MSFRSINHKYLAPAAQGVMIFGIVSLCQPWSLFLHKYGVTLTLFGLIAFMITSKIAPDPAPEEVFDDEFSDAQSSHKDGGNL